jgi:hypothetical protein
MKKQSWGGLLLLVLIVVALAGGIFLVCRHFGGAAASEHAGGPVTATAGGTQMFSGDGYSLGVPADWHVEQDGAGKDMIAAYPDYRAAASSSTATCKIEMSVFPYASSTSVADWISGRIGADPSLVVTEQSSEDIAINGGSGVKWNGLIDGAPTTLVYAFSSDHAYEIAPSVINEASAGNAPCTAALETFLSQLTIQ